MSAVEYPSNRGYRRLDIDVHNSVLSGKVQIIRAAARYLVRFDYEIHSDTQRRLSGVRAIIVAEYRGADLEPVFFCQELVSGTADVARVVARDVVVSVLRLAARALD